MEDGGLDETVGWQNTENSGPIETTLRKYWGYEGFLPLQREAIEYVVAGRDSVVVLPTGGGKSLCYQVPAVIMPGLAVVVSPLISLMKDQVDGLTDYGIPGPAWTAAFLARSEPTS